MKDWRHSIKCIFTQKTHIFFNYSYKQTQQKMKHSKKIENQILIKMKNGLKDVTINNNSLKVVENKILTKILLMAQCFF